MEGLEAFTQSALFKRFAGQLDGLNRHVFDHDMGRHGDAGVDIAMGRVEQGNGAAIRMANQNRPLNGPSVEQLGQDQLGLTVHVVWLETAASNLTVWALLGGPPHICHRIRLAIALPRIDQASTAELLTKQAWPVAPHAHTAQTFVQKNQNWVFLSRWRGDELGLQLDAEHVCFFAHGPMHLRGFQIRWGRAILRVF
jgi:hypothetical protein